MATLSLPMPSGPSELTRVTLDGVEYTLDWNWNERDAHWSLSLGLPDGTPLASGLRVVIGWDLLNNVTAEAAPKGALIFFDQSTSETSLTGEDPGLDDLGDRVQGYYVEQVDADVLRALP